IRDRRPERQEFAEEHIAALTPRLCRLRIVAPQEARAPGLVVLRNGVPLGEGAWGDALAVDPGEQIVEARRSGALPMRLTVRVGEGEQRDVTIPALRPAPTAATHHPVRSLTGW